MQLSGNDPIHFFIKQRKIYTTERARFDVQKILKKQKTNIFIQLICF